MLEIEKQGKIKGLGTMPRQKVGLHKGWRGTRFESRSVVSGTDRGRIPNRASTPHAYVVLASSELPR